MKKNNTKSVIKHVFMSPGNEEYDFCMCNPPFYSTLQELCESRSPARYLNDILNGITAVNGVYIYYNANH